MIVLALVVLLTGLALAYFSRTTTDRQLAQSSYNDTSADLLARSALDIVVNDFKGEILSGQPVSSTNIEPARYTPTPPVSGSPIANLIRQSFSGDPTGRTSSVNSGTTSANGRSISTARWNSHYLIPRATPGPGQDWNTIYSDPVPSFTAPDWVLVTGQGPTPAPAPSAVIGRYAVAVYDEGGSLDMNLAGSPDWPAATTGPPSPPTPTPWGTNVGRKGILALADLTALEVTPGSTPTQSPINKIVGWRNFANTGQSDGTFGSPSFSNNRKTQDTYGSFFLDFGDPPYNSPSPFPTYPFTSVDTATVGTPPRTDQAFMTRQELLKLRSSLDFSQNLLQYMGTFSRERNQPARDWNRLNGHLPDRYDIMNIGLVKPNPGGTPKPNRGKGGTKGVGRGRFRGDAASILDLFGLEWVNGINTIPGSFPPQPMPTSDIRYWPHWRYVGRPGFTCNPNGHGCDHIPALRGGRNDLFQLLDYAIKGQANGTNDDTVNVATILGVGASLFDQYDYSGNPSTSDLGDDAVFPSVSTSPSPWPWPGATPLPTHTTIIEYDRFGAGYVLGWERQDRETNDPHGPLGKPAPAPGSTPIVLDHAFTTTAELGYGLKTEDGFTPLDLHTAGNNDSALLDFFTYNPVDHSYPRLGIVNLNTKNVPILAALLQMALKKDFDGPAPSPTPTPAITHGEAMAAAQAIVDATSVQPAVNRADISRLTSVAAGSLSTIGANSSAEEIDKCKESIARALSELGQARTWNLFIDVIAQTGRYAPGTTNVTQANKFIVEGEKRYWLHIALGRDLNADGSVDVLGTQLEEVIQ